MAPRFTLQGIGIAELASRRWELSALDQLALLVPRLKQMEYASVAFG